MRALGSLGLRWFALSYLVRFEKDGFDENGLEEER